MLKWQEFYKELPGNIDELEANLIKDFSPTKARRLYYADLYKRIEDDTESTDDFGRDMQQLVWGACSSMLVEHQDTLMREHFVNSSCPEQKQIVLIVKPQTFGKALQIA